MREHLHQIVKILEIEKGAPTLSTSELWKNNGETFHLLRKYSLVRKHY